MVAVPIFASVSRHVVVMHHERAIFPISEGHKTNDKIAGGNVREIMKVFLYIVILGIAINLLTNLVWSYMPGSDITVNIVLSVSLVLVIIVLSILYPRHYQDSNKHSANTNDRYWQNRIAKLEIIDVQNEHSFIRYDGGKGDITKAADMIKVIFTIRNNGTQDAFLKRIRIEENKRIFHPSMGIIEPVGVSFEKVIVINDLSIDIQIPISYRIPENKVGQFALLFASNVKAGNLEVWLTVTLDYDQDLNVVRNIHLSLQNYGYEVKLAEDRGFVITPGA